MSFRIFAAGTEGFNYSADNCADQDLFQAAEVMNAMRAAGPSPAGIGEGVADYVLPSAEGEAQAGIPARPRFDHSCTLRGWGNPPGEL
jgi:hypothetical protein